MAEGERSAAMDRTFAFGPFRLRPGAQLLLEGETPVHIGARALDLLIALVECADRIVTKDELFGRVWPGLVVDEGNIRTQMALLRKALRDGQDGARYLLTIPGRGYRFVGSLSILGTSGRIETRMPPVQAASSLPTRLTRLIGRETAIADILGRLSRHRLVTIVGPGGIGKTSVALAAAGEAASSYSDGVHLVDCGPLTGTSLVPQKMAATLGINSSVEDPTRGLTGYLSGKRMLIVLDCCERVVEAVAVLVESLLKGAASVCILATSREPLRAEGESVYRLPSLEIPAALGGLTADKALAYPAVELFVERVKANVGQFDLCDADAPVVADICRRLDGIALAIELAAGRVGAFGLLGVAARLEDRLRLLTQGRRTALPRHQTLTATLDWSYDALEESEQVVLRRLSVFTGGFTLEGAQVVAADAPVLASDIVDIVASLVSKSLLNADVAAAIGHYRPLDMTREYALTKLMKSGEFDRTARRHARHVQDLLQRAGADAAALTSRATTRLSAESRLIDEARAAIDWAFSSGGDVDAGVKLTVACIPLWASLSLNGECRRYAKHALLAGKAGFGVNDPREMQLLTALGGAIVWTQGPGVEADAAFTRALAIAEALDDVDYQIRVLWGLWASHFNSGRIRMSLDTAKRLRSVSADSGDVAAALVGERTVGMSLLYLGDHAGSRRHAETLIRRYIRPKDRSHIVRFQFDPRIVARTLRAKVLWAQGFPEQAMQEARDAVEEARTVGHALSTALTLAQGACPVTLLSGDLAAAEHFIGLLLDHTVEHALDPWHDWAECFSAMLLIARGRTEEGLANLRKTLEELPRGAFFAHYAGIQATLAEALGRIESISAGHRIIDEALKRSEHHGERWYVAEFLRIKGELLRAEQTPGSRAEAEEQFRRSLACAREQQALSWELRTSISLARLHQGQEQIAEARSTLGPVYARFEEGFDTADLRAAIALLRELAE
jgi:predicted ATPase/DNA-binding winged helix-turn-helix (wHTH) protein